MKKKYYMCYGCFKVHVGNPDKPFDFCCEKHHNEPYALEQVTDKEYREYLLRLISDSCQ